MSAVLAARPRHAPPDPRQLWRCLLLAALLHVWLVLMFGNASGSAAPGQGVWGSLTVKLLGKGDGRSDGEPGAPPGEPVREWRDNGAAGSGTQPRQGGQVRPTEPAPAADTGAAELGRWQPTEVPAEMPAESANAHAPSPAPPRTATLALPEGFRPIEREHVAAPSAAPAQPPSPLPELPAAIGRLEARPEATVTPLPSPASLSPPLRTEALPALNGDVPTTAVNRLDATPARPAAAATLPRPADLRALPAATAIAPSADLPAPVRRLEAPAEAGVARALPPSSDLRATPALPAAAATLPDAQDLPSAVRRLEPADGASRVVPLQPPAASPRAALPAPAAAAVSELAGGLPAPVSAPAGAAGGAPGIDLYGVPKASAGSPDAGARLGRDLALPPSAAASAPRAPLNLSLPRSGDIAARRGLGVIDALPQPPERKSRLEQSIEDAANADCRKAYAGAGLLAIVPLAVDAARGKGCKW